MYKKPAAIWLKGSSRPVLRYRRLWSSWNRPGNERLCAGPKVWLMRWRGGTVVEKSRTNHLNYCNYSAMHKRYR
ncbi:MAG TPA: hypothetical protein HA304_02370 [Methanosarcinales archaeon]|nr:hypothetical protein [Methanosarcinales archaeon]